MATKTKRRRKSRSERGEELRRAGKAEHMGDGRYRIRAMSGDATHEAVWRQGKLERGCTCSDPCLSELSGHWDHCVHIWAAIADRDAALAAAETTEERARVMRDLGDVHVRDGRDFALFGTEPYVLVEDLRKSYRLPLDLSSCKCEEFAETDGACAHVLAARLEMADLAAADYLAHYLEEPGSLARAGADGRRELEHAVRRIVDATVEEVRAEAREAAETTEVPADEREAGR